MTKLQIFTVNYLNTVYSVQIIAWEISVHFDLTGIEFNLSITRTYVYQESSYSAVYIKHNKMNCFHLDSHYTINDLW